MPGTYTSLQRPSANAGKGLWARLTATHTELHIELHLEGEAERLFHIEGNRERKTHESSHLFRKRYLGQPVQCDLQANGSATVQRQARGTVSPCLNKGVQHGMLCCNQTQMDIRKVFRGHDGSSDRLLVLAKVHIKITQDDALVKAVVAELGLSFICNDTLGDGCICICLVQLLFGLQWNVNLRE